MPFLLSFVVEVADTLSRIVFRSFSLSLLLLAASGTIRAQAQDPFTQNRLPDLGMMPESHEGEKHFAEMAKAFGEASMKNNDLDTGEQARQFAFGQVRDVVSEQVNQQLESWLSAWGSASVDINVDNEGHFNGSHGSWFIPLQDKQRYLTWSQLGLTQQTDGLVSNVGIGQRWAQDGWLLGYNTFYDNLLDENLQRAGFGAEAWGEYLRLSANYYQPFADWQTHTATLEQRMARGYDINAQMRLPFYQHINTSVSLEQYFGDSVDLFDSGTGYHNPVALKLGLNYTPVPLLTMTAQHKQGESGVSQNNLGLTLNYRFGVPLKKQLAASEVAQSQSLRGSRYDTPQRNSLPISLIRWGRKITRNGKPSLSTATVKWWRQTVQLVSAGAKKADGTSNSATGLPVQKLNCSSACWAARMRLLTWASRISAARVQSTLIMWRWITSCCINCRQNVCNWPMVLQR